MFKRGVEFEVPSFPLLFAGDMTDPFEALETVPELLLEATLGFEEGDATAFLAFSPALVAADIAALPAPWFE